MTPEQIRAAIRQAGEAWVSGDADRFATLFLPDGEFIVPGYRWQGQQAIHDVMTEFTATHSDVRVDIRRILVEGNSAVVEWVWEETETQTGNRTQAEDAIAVDFDQGQIRRWREYIDAESPKAKR
jgi:uncharacterized protein (TIGR02246 family)